MFYTYMWLRENGTPYYVGKGSGDRVFRIHRRIGRAPLERVVIYVSKDEDDAFETEKLLIWYYGRKDLGTGCLVNLSDGGEKPPSPKGRVWEEHSRKKLSEAAKRRTYSEADRASMSRSAKARIRAPFTEETCRRISDAMKGKVRSEGSRRKQSIACKGRIPWNKGLKKAQERLNEQSINS